MGFGRACTPVRCAHPSFWAHCHAKRGAARPPHRPSQLRCFLFDPQKYIKSVELGPPTSRALFFPQEHRGPPAPRSPIAALLILPAIFWGQNYVPVPPYALIFFWFFFSIVFGSFFILFPFYSPFQFLLILLFLSLLILLVGAILRLLFLLLLYFKLFVDLQTCILMIYVHISVILRGFSKGPSLFYLLILLY